MAHSGSRYPGVPATTVDMWVFSSLKDLDNPKSPILTSKFLVNRIFELFTSL